jgi:hypothetical protein
MPNSDVPAPDEHSDPDEYERANAARRGHDPVAWRAQILAREALPLASAGAIAPHAERMRKLGGLRDDVDGILLHDDGGSTPARSVRHPSPRRGPGDIARFVCVDALDDGPATLVGWFSLGRATGLRG